MLENTLTIKAQKILPLLLIALTSTVSANTVNENIKLSHLQKVSHDAHDVVIEINYMLAEKCNRALSVDEVVNTVPLFSFLVAMRSVTRDSVSTAPYKSALKGMECDNLSAGIPKKFPKE